MEYLPKSPFGPRLSVGKKQVVLVTPLGRAREGGVVKIDYANADGSINEVWLKLGIKAWP